MTLSLDPGRCGCGALAGPLGTCADYYHAILAQEQGDPRMYPWHAPVVCAYLLQHPAEGSAKHLDVQFRMLQLYLDRGLDQLQRVAAHQVARNNHRSRLGYDMTPFEPFERLPAGGPPASFAAAFCGLPVEDSSFVADGHENYGHRIKIISEATVAAWRSLAP